jgi:hypothetical protein
MRKSTLFIGLTAVGCLCLAGLIGLYPIVAGKATARRIDGERLIVGRLALTDLCLFTEASYTRHPNLADRFVPFQDHPMAASHFPSESLLGPPTHLWEMPVLQEKGSLP